MKAKSLNSTNQTGENWGNKKKTGCHVLFILITCIDTSGTDLVFFSGRVMCNLCFLANPCILIYVPKKALVLDFNERRLNGHSPLL